MAISVGSVQGKEGKWCLTDPDNTQVANTEFFDTLEEAKAAYEAKSNPGEYLLFMMPAKQFRISRERTDSIEVTRMP